MAQPIKVYYDQEGDFLEVLFSDEPGYMRETNHSDVMARVSEKGGILGFAIMQVSSHDKDKPLLADLSWPSVC